MFLPRASRARVFIAAVVLLLAAPALAVGAFSPSAFKFEVERKDDGKEAAGGWQVAVAQLRFVDTRSFIPRIWSCRMKVGMALRAEVLGRISPGYAAQVTAEVATKASAEVMHRRPEWLTAAFCIDFRNEMNILFGRDHVYLGARVNEF